LLILFTFYLVHNK